MIGSFLAILKQKVLSKGNPGGSMAYVLINNYRECILNVQQIMGVTLNQTLAYQWLKEAVDDNIYREVKEVPLLA